VKLNELRERFRSRPPAQEPAEAPPEAPPEACSVSIPVDLVYPRPSSAGRWIELSSELWDASSPIPELLVDELRREGWPENTEVRWSTDDGLPPLLGSPTIVLIPPREHLADRPRPSPLDVEFDDRPRPVPLEVEMDLRSGNYRIWVPTYIQEASER